MGNYESEIDTEYIVTFDWRIRDIVGITNNDLVYFLKHTTAPAFKTMSPKEFRYALDYLNFDVITNGEGQIVAIGGIASHCEHFNKDRAKTYTLWYAATEEVGKYLKTLTTACYHKLLTKISNIDKVFSSIHDDTERLYFEKMLNMKETFEIVGMCISGTGEDILKKIKKQ